MLAAAFAASGETKAPATAAERVRSLAAQSYSRYLDLLPHEETLNIGAGPRMDRLVPFVSIEQEKRQRAHHRRVLAQLKAIPASGLRDTDRASAESYLQKAADSGDVHAALRLGMLLWERRDLDAAEEMLRSATDDPQGAYALGLLLWRERGNAGAAVEWLDRAAQADDPSAERDLGILLRENGDIQGAHHWLSRAADRDGEARHALAELVESH